MTRSGDRDPAELGRGALTRWLPVLWQAPADPPAATPFRVDPSTTPTRFLLRVIFSARRYTVPAALLGIGWQVGEALVPVVMGLAIDRALETGDAAQLVLWLAALAAVFLLLSLSYRLASQLTERATETLQHRLRATLSRSVLHADGPGAQAPDGRVVSLMTNDVMRTAAAALTVYPIAEFCGILFIAVSLLVISWPLGLGVLVGAPLTVWLMGVLSGRLARSTREYQTLLADTVGRATDLVAGYRVIKGVRAEDEAARRYRVASQQTLAGAYRNATLLGRFLVGSNTISGVFVAAVAAAAGWFAITGRLSVGGLIAAVGLSQALLSPMRMLAMNAVPAWAAANASSGRVLDALRDAPQSRRGTAAGEPAEPGEPAERESTPTTPGAAHADRHLTGLDAGEPDPGVTLSIRDREVVRVRAGELVGLHADDRTASAVVEALLHPHTPGDVRVRVGDREPDLGVYRATVTVSPHHALLFSGSVADNLALADAGPLRQQEALHAAACDDFVETIGGPDAPIGEMGNRLSGGQRQRLALARALAADAPVLVLHDPTTAVDSVTEQAIAGRMRSIRHDRSTLLIASSPALLGVCDRVIDLGEPANETEHGEGA